MKRNLGFDGTSTDAQCRRLNAFTLIELLVVIAIIAILASLLLPVLSQTRSKAASAACKGNLRQWGLASSMYADDHGAYAPYSMTDAAGANRSKWHSRLTKCLRIPDLAWDWMPGLSE